MFYHPDLEKEADGVAKIVNKIVQSGKAWLSVYPIHGQPTFRACITNFASSMEDIAELIELLNDYINDSSSSITL